MLLTFVNQKFPRPMLPRLDQRVLLGGGRRVDWKQLRYHWRLGQTIYQGAAGRAARGERA